MLFLRKNVCRTSQQVQEQLSYLHGADEVVHAAVVDVDHGIVQPVLPAQQHHLQGTKAQQLHSCS